MVIDGSGLPRCPADIGVRHGRIGAIGRIRERAREVIDADGQAVTPGFVDGHTHMDAQIFWDPLGTCSCWHGVTTVVMGNCGFTLAPCGKSERHLVVRNLERAEDIAAEAMDAGIEWTWTTFPEFLDRVDALPKGINYACYVGHSALRAYHVRLRDLAVESGRPVTWGLFSRRDDPEVWRTYLDLLEETAAAGGRMFAQVHSRALAVVLSFKTNLPFDRLPVWKDLRALPLDEQKRRLRDPDLRRRLVEAAHQRDERRAIGAEPRPAAYEWIFVFDTVEGPHRSVADVARERGLDPVEAMIALALETDLERFFLQPIANENQAHALELIKHPRTVVTFSDSGAPVSQIMDASPP